MTEQLPSSAIPSSQPHPLQRKLQTLLSSPLFSPLYSDAQTTEQLQSSLDALSQFYYNPIKSNEQTSLTNFDKEAALNIDSIRKNLVNDLEREGVNLNNKFLKEFENVVKDVANLDAQINSIADCCDQMYSKLEDINRKTRGVLNQAGELKSKIKQTDIQQTIVTKFLDTFTLTESQITALSLTQTTDAKGKTIPNLTPQFFAALKRVNEIEENVKTILRDEGGRVSHEILSLTTTYLESTYQHLHSYISSNLQIFSQFYPEPEPILTQSLRVLVSRPVLFHSIVADIIEHRKNAILRMFLDALVRGGSGGGGGRAIDLLAHDPVRYAGDMLGWIYKCVMDEKELWEDIFGLESNPISPIAPAATGNYTPTASSVLVTTTIRHILSSSLASLTKPLKTRIEQSLHPPSLSSLSFSSPGSSDLHDGNFGVESSITAFKVANLVAFYEVMVGRVVEGSKDSTRNDAVATETGGTLVEGLKDLKHSTYKIFLDSVHRQSKILLSDIQKPEVDLAPTANVKVMIGQMREILQTYASSVTSSLSTVPSSLDFRVGTQTDHVKNGDAEKSPDDHQYEPEDSFQKILDAVIDPLIQTCVISSGMLGSQIESGVFMLNCLGEIRNALAQHEFVKNKLMTLEIQIEAHLEVLILEQHNVIMKQSGLWDVWRAVKGNYSKTPLSHLPLFSTSSLTTIFSSLDNFLITAELDVSSNLSKLLNHDWASLITKKGLEAFVKSYKEVEETIVNQVQFGQTVVKRGWKEVGVLVGVDVDTLDLS
ncbi:oligomeric Golgi complex subunit 6 [Paraphysoderma sedebokerense]|nr:oligomeric Golgi complex subunit 6 [Paraphysoderma sedebokerense]